MTKPATEFNEERLAVLLESYRLLPEAMQRMLDVEHGGMTECCRKLVSIGDLRAPVGRMQVAATRRCWDIVEERRRSRRSAAAAKHPQKQV